MRLHDLAERPVRDAVAVGKAAALAPGDQLVVLVHHTAELGHEAALADPGDADERHELRRAVATRTPKRVDEQVELVVAPDERRTGGGTQVDAEPRPRLDRLPDGNGLRLALCLDGLRLAVDDLALGRAVRLLADEDPVDRRCRLKASSRVHHVARDHPLTVARGGVERDERLTRVHRDPNVEIAPGLLLVQHGDRVAHGERRTHGPLGVVLVRDGRAEDRDDRVADELLHRAAEALELVARPLVVDPQERADVLRVALLGARRRPDEIGEDDADDLPLLTPRYGRRAGQRSTALRAEFRGLRVRRAAGRTGPHPRGV